MKYLSFFFILSLIIFSNCSVSQIGNIIPNDRVVDWTKAGYHNDSSENLPKYVDSVFVSKPSSNPDINYNNITKKIKEASQRKGLTAVILKNGIYNISKPINFGIDQRNIVLKGSGNTELLFIGKSSEASNIIRIIGKRSDWDKEIEINSYNDNSKSINIKAKLNGFKVGDFIEIRVPNGSWHDSEHHERWNPQNYLGTIAKIVKVDESKKQISVDQSLKTLWNLSQKDNLKPTFVKFTPIEEIGIESLKISTDNENNRVGFNINLTHAANCWVKNIESVYAASAHLNIGNSTSITVINSTFHHAKDYGNPAVPEEKLIAGTGYGVNIARSSNCLIENNVFYHLRHAMIIALGSDRNVFGYNYSYDQFSFPFKNLSDLNLHGHYPFDNLFEGNVVERIHADQWWGSNGPNNTFIRNIVKDGTIKLEKTNRANVLGNEAKLVLIDSKSQYETYSENESQENWSKTSEKNASLYVISYYRKSKPSFFNKEYSWPPIGPSIKSGVILLNKIPAQEIVKD